MSSNWINFRQLNVNEKCSNFIQVAPWKLVDLSHHMHCAGKLDTDVEYFGRVKMVLSSHVGSINVAYPANIRKAHKELNDSGKKGGYTYY